MEHTVETTPSYFNITLLMIAFLSRLAEEIIVNYDFYFKLLSIISLLLVIFVNMGKFFAQMIETFNKFKTWFKSFKKK